MRLKQLKEATTQNNSLISQQFIGTIVDNNDPTLNSRVKVSIKSLTDKLSTEDLPFYSIKLQSGTVTNSQSAIPPNKSRVVVEFKQDNIYSGVVTAVIPSKAPEPTQGN
jgi:hypothetical protein